MRLVDSLLDTGDELGGCCGLGDVDVDAFGFGLEDSIFIS
jgi:hypothetical protein